MAPLKNCSSDLLNNGENFSTGQIVQAKFNKSWWPAVVITADMCGRDECTKGYTWVFWFGDHKISKVAYNNIKDFMATYSGDTHSSKLYERALYDALHEITWRTGKEIPAENRDELRKFAKLKLNKSLKISFRSFSEQLDQDLTQIRKRNLALKGKQHTEAKDKEVLEENSNSLNKNGNAVAVVRNGKKREQGVCMGCVDPRRDVVAKHPLFEGGLCIQCKPAVMHSFENFDASTFSGCCILCGQGGELIVCGKSGCCRSYCEPCISHFVGDDAFEEFVDTDPWYCFLCAPKANSPQDLTPRESPMVVETTLEFLKPPLFKKLHNKNNNKPTVLSFDDTGFSVLGELKIPVDMYYVMNNGEKDTFSPEVEAIKYLGGFIDASKSHEFQQLVPEVLIGSAIINCPWSEKNCDLTSANAHQFQYAIEFVHILRSVKKTRNNVLWLYVAESWGVEPNKEQISRNFECRPVVMNLHIGKSYYIWGNTTDMERKYTEIKNTRKRAALRDPPLGEHQAAKDYKVILRKFLAPLKQYFC